jgi:lipopolysaccharide/colanic/teichoic acid biosynthesis glycosyltransferase
VTLPTDSAVLLPVLAVIAIAILFDDGGPILYRAERTGLLGRPFQVLRFRSVRAGCPAAPHFAFVRTLLRDGANCSVYTAPDDSRITRVGTFLRRSSLDELPSSGTCCAAT